MPLVNLNAGHLLLPRTEAVRDLGDVMRLLAIPQTGLDVKGIKFDVGLNVVFGATGIGKSVLMNSIGALAEPERDVMFAVLDESTPDGSSFTSLAEVALAIRSNYVVDTTQADLDALDFELVEELAETELVVDALLDAYTTGLSTDLSAFLDDVTKFFPSFVRSSMPTPTLTVTKPMVLMIDSFRLLQFNSGGSIRSGGIDNGFFNTLTDLDNICRANQVVMFASFNPMSTDDKKRQELLDLVEASVTGTIEVLSVTDFTMRSRSDNRVSRSHSLPITNNVSGAGSSSSTGSLGGQLAFAATQPPQMQLAHHARNVLRGINP